MGTLTHKAARAAYGTAIDAVLKHVKKDREKGLLELVDLTEKYMGDNFQKENYEAMAVPNIRMVGLRLI